MPFGAGPITVIRRSASSIAALGAPIPDKREGSTVAGALGARLNGPCQIQAYGTGQYRTMTMLERTPDSPALRTVLAEHPRLLILDMTRIGDGTATGEIKKMLLRHWPKEKLAQIYSAGPSQVALNVSADGTTGSPDPVASAELNARIAAFRPEMILYRPVADQPALHDCAMRLIRAPAPPLALWIMDDWMDRLRQADPALHEAMDADLRGLIGKASALFAISTPMAEMLAERYGGKWQVFSNAIDPDDWTSPPPRESSTGLVIRYAGGLAEDMSLNSLRRIAGVIDSLAPAHDVSLHINTRAYWAGKAAHHFAGLRAVRITTEAMNEREYRAWLSAADAVLIAYNFDPATKTYVQYSMANKLPECLASGAATLAYGPRGIATIDALRACGCAHVVSEDDDAMLRVAILSLLENREARIALGARARAYAFERFNLAEHAERFREAIRCAVSARSAVCNTARASAAPHLAAPDNAILQERKLPTTEPFAQSLALGAGRTAMSGEEAFDAGLATVRQELQQIREALVENERRSALMLKRLTGLVNHVQSKPGDPAVPAASRDMSDLNAAIAQLRRELAGVREDLAEQEQRGALLLRKTALLTEHVTSHPSSRPAPPRTRSALRSIGRLPGRLVTMATGKKAKSPAQPAQRPVGKDDGTPIPNEQSAMQHAEPTPEGSVAFSVRTEWVDLKFDEVGIVLAWTLDGRPIVTTLAVRQQDIIEVRIESHALAHSDETIAPFSLILSTEGRSGDEILAELNARLVKKHEAARNPASNRFLEHLSCRLPDIVRTIT